MQSNFERKDPRLNSGQTIGLIEAIKIINELLNNPEKVNSALTRIQDAIAGKTNPRK